MKHHLSLLLLIALTTVKAQTFTNPLLPSGADPWCIFHDGYYYYTQTLGNRIDLWKTRSIAKIQDSERKTVWTAPDTGLYSRNIWAPELHFLGGKWYIYFAADGGKNVDHRLWVLENSSADPLRGEWKVKGKLATPGDKWSIDGSVFRYKKTLYLIWSGWEGDTNGQQNIYIAKMTNPWTVGGKRTMISSPTYDWERNGTLNNSNDVSQVFVNEGPEVLERKGKLYLVYSASGCWTDLYTLGLLQAKGTDLMQAATWKKFPEPVFTRSIDRKVYAPGHNSFFKSPDGKEDWLLYHANEEPGQGCGRFRSPRAQKFTWTKDGSPYFGEPVAAGVPIPLPSGTQRDTSQPVRMGRAFR